MKIILQIALVCVSLVSSTCLSVGQSCSFSLVQDSGCIPIPILGNANDTLASPPVVQRNWVLTTCGGSTVFSSLGSLSPTFSYVPTTPGCYNLTMTSTDQNGQTCSFTYPNIAVADTPNPTGTIGPASFCAPQTVTLNLTCNPGCGSIDQTQIQWGCGNISTFSNCPGSATHIYSGNCNPQCYNVNVVMRNTCGCIGTKRFPSAVCVLAKPVANFSVDNASGVCVNSITSNFTATGNGPGYTYSWFVNGVQEQSNTSLTFTKTFAASITCYQIKLVVSNSSGCVDSMVRDNYICVYASPLLSFTKDTSSLCVDSGQAGLLCLHNTSVPFLPNPMWRVSGGNPVTNLGPFFGDSVCIPLTRSGQYQVTLIGNYGGSCIDSLVVPNAFNLKQNPRVCFYANDSVDCRVPFCTIFNNCTSTPPGSTYAWNFGPGATPTTTSTLQNPPQICYNTLGKKDVSLTVTSTNGCIKKLTKPQYIIVDTLHPDIFSTDNYGCAPLYAAPQVYTAVPPGAPYILQTFKWWCYFHNTGIPGWTPNPRFGSVPTYNFTQPGCYDFKLELTTSNGCVATAWDTATICVGEPPVCTMTYGPDTMCFEKDSVVFTFSGPNCNTNRFIVHFGDESSPTATTFFNQSPIIHTYLSFGEFDAWIVPVQDSCESDSIYTAHVVINPPSARFNSSTSCMSGDTVCLVNGSLGANRYHWSFNCAPDTFNTFSPCIVLPHCDTCGVTLTAYNDTTGCVHSVSKVVQTACGSVNATASPSIIQGCELVQDTLKNTTPGASAGQTYWDMDLSDGIQVPCQTNCYAAQNVYLGFSPSESDIAMTYIAPGGCRDTVIIHKRICALRANFSPTSVCLPDSFRFVASSFQGSALPITGCDSLVAWRWDFGNNDTSHEQFPVRAFPVGNYSVTLTITNSIGCTATVTKTIHSGTPVYATWGVDSNLCPGSTICISNTTFSAAPLTETWQFPGSNLPTYNGHTPPCLTYNTPGDFPLTYTIAAGSCNRTETVMMHVHAPVLSGSLSQTYASCPPLAVCANNTSQWVDTLTDIYTWDFGNLEYLEVNPCDFYSYPGVYPVLLSVVTDNGCRDTVLIDTVIVDGPYGSISHSPVGVCSCEDTVDFVISSVKASELVFVHGCNQNFTIVNPILPIGTDLNPTVFNYRLPYCIADSCIPQVTFGDASGCHVLYNDTVLYVDSPTVGMTFNNYGICVAGNIDFFEATTYTLPPNISHSVDWYWDFGDPYDPTPSTLQNPSHYYSQPGSYPVTLKIHSNFGCYDSIINTGVVSVPKMPIAGFYADDSLICAETSTCFHDTSYVDSITGPQFWYWNFGDGNTDSVSGPNPCHTYMTGGNYTVQLCLYDSIGCVGCDSSFVLQVIAKPIADAGPDTVFCYGVQTLLNGSGASSCSWAPASLVSNSAICNPTTTLVQDTSFVLTVTDSHGCFGVDTLHVAIGQVFANFTLGTNTFCLEDSVCVTDSSISLNGVLSAWDYDFGDNSSLTGANVCHMYSAPGNYTISQTVTDNHGCTDTSSHNIIVLPQPVAAFSLSDTVICSNQQVCFTDLSTSVIPIQNWSWDFGSNQGTFTGANPPCHLFTPPFLPNYPTTLVITDQNACRDTATVTITVNEVPQANFNWQLNCEDTSMPFTNTSINGDGAIDSCNWLFWLGAPAPTNSYSCNTSFHFPPGSHDVQLIVHDLNGCRDTIVKTVLTDSLSQLTVFPGDTTVCLGTAVDYQVSGVFDNITWTPNVWLSDPNSSVVTVNPLGNIGYIVSAVNGVCAAASDTFSIQVIQPIPIEVHATPEQIVLGLSSNITSQIPGQIDSIVWTPEATLDCSNCPNPVAKPTQTTTYYATVYYSQGGITCTNTANVTITVLNSCSESIIYVPNTFTPNGDGLNDVFMIRGLAATKIHYFRIYNRWGQLVFETSNGGTNEPRWGWDGTDRSGEKLNSAVFVYTYEIECINGEVVNGKGNVTLVR